MSTGPVSLEAQPRQVKTSIDFGVKSSILKLSNVSRLLDLKPTHGFEANATYMGMVGKEQTRIERSRPSFGVWHFDTGRFLDDKALQEHAIFLLSRLEPVAEQVLALIQDPDYTVAMILWHVGPTGFEFQSNILQRLSRLSEWMSFSCWETEEVEGAPHA